MATNRAGGSWRGVERTRKATRFPQLPPAPADYPTFPDTSTWPVVFPELPPSPGGGPHRPPQHTSKAAAPLIAADQLPNHVAIVMDGNGRWATQRGLHRTEGHKMGEAVLIDITCGAIEVGVKWLTVYAFSTENWKRSADEVRFLMGFNREVVRRRRENLKAMGVRMRWVGSRPRMWRSVIKEFEIAENMTTGTHVITINYCVNYGGRTEIAEAARAIAREVAAGKLNPSRITEATVARHLHRPDIPDVDLLIRTSGEQRSSNFMLWQAAYAEYIFQDKLWPDYDRRDLWAACQEYASRRRRFGSA
jgi:trans,polycis-decaprenyl diphosphate synthase